MQKKRAFAWIIAAVMAVSLAACGSSNQEETTVSEAREPEPVSEESAIIPESGIEPEVLDTEEDLDTGDAAENAQDSQDEDEQSEDGSDVAQASDTSQAAQLAETAAAAEQQATATGGGTLVVYFSRHGSSVGDTDADAVSSASLSPGNVIVVANMVEQLTGADTFQLVTADPYPKDYRETTNVARTEADNGARPALSSQISNMDDYDTIILGYPNWWGTIPMPVAAFLETYDLSGKTIIPYCVHEGSGLGSSVGDITALAPNSTVLSGLSISTGSVSSASDSVTEWLRGHGIVA